VSPKKGQLNNAIVALGVNAMADAAARRYAHDHRFTFGTGKIEVMVEFASALFLLGVAAAMVVASVECILRPRTIRSREAMAVLGLLVYIVCELILGKAHHYDLELPIVMRTVTERMTITIRCPQTTTSTCALLTCIWWRMPPPQCWRLQRWPAGGG
jgi:Co/Zn/Cd efflux system component